MSITKNYFLKSLPVFAIGLAILAPDSSNAAIVWSQSTNIQEIDGVSFWEQGDRIPSSQTNLLAFNEAQNVIVNQSQAITTNRKNPDYIPNSSFANYDPSVPRSSQNTLLEYDWDYLAPATDLPVLPTGTYSSHFFYMLTPTNRRFIEATVVFDAPIAGLMGDPTLINTSNSVFSRASDLKFATGTLEGLEWFDPNTRDYVKVVGEMGNILQIRMTSQGFEPLRVITTVPAPEPLTILGSGTAISFAAFFKRKLSKKKEK